MTRLLILDDLEDYLRALSNALRRDFEIVTAKSLEEARPLAEGVSLALVDIRLSKDNSENRDGLGFAKWAHRALPDLIVVLMSAYRDTPEVIGALERREAAYFLGKPIELVELRRILTQLATSGTESKMTDELVARLRGQVT